MAMLSIWPLVSSWYNVLSAKDSRWAAAFGVNNRGLASIPSKPRLVADGQAGDLRQS